MESAQTVKFRMENKEGRILVKGELTGQSVIENNLDDLKLKGVIALLNSVDRKNFTLADNGPLFYSLIGEIEDTIKEMKRYESFQGKTD